MNIANRLLEFAKSHPSKTAIIDTRTDESISFSELEDKIARICHSLLAKGLKPGSRTLLFVKPSLDFHALVFSLFKIGIIPVLIDPGMGRKNLLAAIAHTKPDAMIAEPIVHYLSYFFRRPFKSIRHRVWTKDIKRFLKSKRAEDVAQVDPNNTAAILFTSGGTGRPKGVVYTHQIFFEQTRMLQEMFNLNSDDIDLPGFPLFSLFTLAMGMTTLIPDMDPSKPGKCDPAKLSANILKYQATFVAGSPAIWERVANFATESELQFQSIKQVVMFGAPVRNELHEQLIKLLPNGNTYAPYGATEALPLCLSDGRWLLQNTKDKTNAGAGTCVGAAVAGVEIKILRILDREVRHLEDHLVLGPEQVGEIIVKGPTVTRSYDQMPEATANAKIQDGDDFWHRMGDIGYLDQNQRLWFCGRKAHRVESNFGLLCPIQVEAIFNQHPKVKRSALIGNSENVPAIVVELISGQKPNLRLKEELTQLATTSSKTSSISLIFFSSSFPVDVRHNIKIDRKKLAQQFF
tara:strand:- start:59032 stop:60588 length:1557 start_codon:yes stop_codon:yes gene_type:complete